MAQNTAPIYTQVPKIGRAAWTSSTTANTTSDGTGTIGTNILLVFTADSTDGSFVSRIRLIPTATTAATATTATVARIYVSTQSSGATTSSNTTLISEVACPSQTADQTTSAVNFYEVELGFALPASSTILVSMHHAAAANTKWEFICFGGDY